MDVLDLWIVYYAILLNFSCTVYPQRAWMLGQQEFVIIHLSCSRINSFWQTESFHHNWPFFEICVHVLWSDVTFGFCNNFDNIFWFFRIKVELELHLPLLIIGIKSKLIPKWGKKDSKINKKVSPEENWRFSKSWSTINSFQKVSNI